MRIGTIIVAGVILFCAAGDCIGASPRQAAAPPAPQTPIRVATKLISVSAIVRDKHGAPITDLTKDDFTILEGKKPRSIEIFTVVQTSVAPPAPQSLPPDTYSNELGAREDSPSNLTIILLDSLNTPSFDRSFPRSQIKKLLLTLQPQDRVALYALGSRLRVLHEFSSDAQSLLDALNKNEDVELLDVDTPPSHATNEHNMQLVPLADENTATEIAQQEGNRAQLTGNAIRAIAEHVSYLPGRKSLIWISDDFPLSFLLDNLERSPDGKKLPYTTENELASRALDQAQIAIYPIDARGLEATGISEIANESVPKQVADMERKANMLALAQRTGGREFTDTNGIMGSIRQTIDSSRVTYELGFYPTDVQWDGSFHKLQVKVKRKDAQVQARDGYYAVGDPTLTPQMVNAMLAQAARGRIEATGIRFTAHVDSLAAGAGGKLTADREPIVSAQTTSTGPAGGPANATSANSAALSAAAAPRIMTLSLTLDPAQFGFHLLNGEIVDDVDVAFISIDAKNRIIQRAAMPLPFKLDQLSFDALVKSGFPVTRAVEIPPEAVELRVVVYDEANSRVGSLRIPIPSAPSATAR
ncbi:MAG: VWA domain-containing protein [Candidatus Acidiferrales bacterium]